MVKGRQFIDGSLWRFFRNSQEQWRQAGKNFRWVGCTLDKVTVRKHTDGSLLMVHGAI